MPELVELNDADANTHEAGNASEADANLAVLVQAANNEVCFVTNMTV